jgi:hypothetical protein
VLSEAPTCFEEHDVAAIQLDSAVTGEDHRILCWRYDQLVRAGYGNDDAVVLASNLDVDLHLAVDLLCRGCPTETAVRIVS